MSSEDTDPSTSSDLEEPIPSTAPVPASSKSAVASAAGSRQPSQPASRVTSRPGSASTSTSARTSRVASATRSRPDTSNITSAAAAAPSSTTANNVTSSSTITEAASPSRVAEASTVARRRPQTAAHEEERIVEFPPGFTYKDDSEELCRYLRPYQLATEFINLHCSFGFACQHRHNIHYLDYGVIVFIAGNTVQILDIFMNKKRVLFGHGHKTNSSIGALAVHPSRNFFAIAERGTNPSIYIYSYPALDVVRILRDGTERSYADITFSHNGGKLASVGGDPDYLLTVWDWNTERVILRTKAFSQDVYRVAFSPVNEGRLITSGAGHIRFWKMAKTFTGLKLQGAIGKFGNVEISDISAFVELPDGKVLSGTESGHLLMWDGNFIQFRIAKPGGRPCHDGNVEFIALENREIITAGADGYVKRWKFDKLEFAEASEEDPIFALEPIQEVKIGPNVHIKGMLRGEDHWIIQDHNGALYKLWIPVYDVEKLLDVHSGAITGLETAPSAHIAVTCGVDSTVRCWDVLTQQSLYIRTFSAPARSMTWAPSTMDDTAQTLVVGFADGIVRILKRHSDSFRLFHTFKPHTAAVVQVAVAPDGKIIATAAEDGTLFFLAIKQQGAQFMPLGFVKLAATPKSISWSADSQYLLLACGPDVIQFRRPDATYESQQNRDTYEIELAHRVYRPLIRDKAKEEAKKQQKEEGDGDEDTKEKDESEDVEEEEIPKEATKVYDISSVIYTPTGNSFFLTLDGGGTIDQPIPFPGRRIETLYECSFLQEEPIRSFHLGKHMGTVTTLSYSHSRKYLCIGTRNGGVQLRALDDLEFFFYTAAHDGSSGGITRVATTWDDRFLLSVGADGQFFAHTMDPQQALLNADRSITQRIAAEKAKKESERKARLEAEAEEQERKRKEEEEKEAKEAMPLSSKEKLAQKLAAVAALTGSASGSKPTSASAAGPTPGTPATATLATPSTGTESTESKSESKDGKDSKDAESKEETKKVEEEVDEEDFDYLSTKIPGTNLTVLPLPSPGTDTSTPMADASDCADITDKSTYSIEEAKLKQEEDDRMATAEQKKDRVRAEITAMRQEYQFLLKKNKSLAKSQQLKEEEFQMEPLLKAEIANETARRVAEVRAELAWQSEKHSIALAKLRHKFLDQLIVEHISLKAFRTGVSVTCFRTPELPPFLRQAIEQVHRMIDHEESQRAAQEQKAVVNQPQEEKEENFSPTNAGRGASRLRGRGSIKGRTGMDAARIQARPAGISEAELRKLARAERQKQLAKLKAAKPDKHVDDPMDVAAVTYAERHMGDYKLKSDPHYIVPEHQRVNAERKRRQMVLLQESVHFIKMGLNERFLAMRDLKSRIINNIARDNIRLRELNKELGITEPLYEPVLDHAEWPEHRELYTKEDIAKWQSEKEREKQRVKDAGRRDIFQHGLGSFQEPEEEKKAAEVKSEAAESKEKSAADDASTNASSSTASAAATTTSTTTSVPSTTTSSPSKPSHPPSRLEKTCSLVSRSVLEHERAALLEKINFAVDTFDAAVAKLRREKFKLDADLKTTDLKVLTLYQELHLLKDFEESENRLFAKLAKARAQKAQVVSDMSECEKQLAHKLAEIKSWQEKDKQVMHDFTTVVGGEKSEFYPQLLKIFKKKKVKRTKKSKAARDGQNNNANNADGDDDDSGDEEGDSDDDDKSSESDSDEDDDDSCPLHCDSTIYEKVLELREKRLEQEEILADFNKAVLELNKTYERHQGRERTIDKELTNTEADIEAFQSEKQRALNLIEVTVPLKLNQMKYLVDGKLPKDISQALIFTSTGLTRLHNRITELGAEKVALSKQLKELKKGHKVLLKELAHKRDLIAIEKTKCEDVQMLKFGQIIDLSILEKVGVDEGAQELRRKLKGLENNSVHKTNEWDQKIEDAKDELAKMTEENTIWLERVAKLTKAQYDLEDQLNTTTKNVHVADTSPVDDKSDAERGQLLELVQIQEREIDALKAEIHVLRRKGGHVYTPQ